MAADTKRGGKHPWTEHTGAPDCQCSRCFTDSCAVPRRSVAADTKRGADEETVLVGKLDGAHISIRLDGLRIALAAQGLHVVTAADKAVLDAMAKASEKDLGRGHRGDWTVSVLSAELARREAAK